MRKYSSDDISEIVFGGGCLSFILLYVVGLGIFWGVVIWAIIKLVNHIVAL